MQKESQRELRLSSNTLPLHAKNTSPYFGEGDKGDRVTINKRGRAINKLRKNKKLKIF